MLAFFPLTTHTRSVHACSFFVSFFSLLRPDALPKAYGQLRRYNQLVLRSLRGDADDASASSVSAIGAVSDDDDVTADEDLPLEQQIKHMNVAAVTNELTAGIDVIRSFGMDAATAVKDKAK